MKYLFFIVFCCFLGLTSAAQNTELIQKLEELKGMMPEVETGKYSHKQTLTFDPENPYRVTLTRVNTELKKGKEETETAEFHIGFLDKNLVKVKPGKKEMQVLFGSGKNDLIKVTEDEKSKGYENDFYILCDDIDNARAIEKALEELIPMAEKIWEDENQLPSDFEGLFDFINSNIGETEQGDEDRTEQELEQDKDFPDRVNFSSEEFDKKGSKGKKEYLFSFGDLNTSKVRMDIKKSRVSVSVFTQKKQNYIEVKDEEEDKSEFTDGLEFLFNTPEQAVLMRKAISAFIPLSRKKTEARLPLPTSLAEAKKMLEDRLKEVKVKEKTLEQSIDFNDNLTTFEIKISDDGKSEEEKRIFDFGDFSEKPDGDVNKNEATITLKNSDSKDYVQVIEDGEQKNYDDEIVFYAADVETHRFLEALLPYIVKESRHEIAHGDFDWMSEEVTKISESNSELSQTFKKESADNDCKVQLELKEDTGKKQGEVMSEFNLYDIDPRSVELKIKGKEVTVIGDTVGKDEIVQQYKDGEKLTFQKEINIPVRNIASGKKMVATLKHLIGECKQ